MLLAEIGGPLGLFGRERRNAAASAMLLLVMLAAVGGWSVAPVMNTSARTLMIGLALLFAGAAQLGQRRAIIAKPTIIASALTVYRSPTPFLVFAFSAWMGAPFSAIVGAAGGVCVVAGVGAGGLVIPRAARVAAGIVLVLVGVFAVLAGLRLV